MSQYRTIKEAAAQLGVNEKTIRRMISTGKIQATQGTEGRRNEWRITQDALDQVSIGRAVEAANSPSAGSVTPPRGKGANPDREALLTALEAMRQELKEARAEVRDLRGQVGQLQDQVIRALPAPRQPSFWERIWPRKQDG